VVGGSLESIVSSEFLNVPYALQTSFGGNALYFVYVSYRMNVSSTNAVTNQTTYASHWGDMGCQYDTKRSVDDYTTSTVIDNEESPGAYCSYTDTTGTMYAFIGTNLSARLMTPLPDMYDDDEEYNQVISSLTLADQVSGGVWHIPTTYFDPLLNRTISIMTYSYPLAFDASGKCTAAVSVDVDRDWFSTHLRSKTFANRDLVMIGVGRSPSGGGRSGLRFVLENLHGSLMANTAADETPLPRVNSLVKTMVANAVGGGSVMQNNSFVLNGLMYQSLTLMDNWVILGVGPTADSTAQVGDAVMSLITSFERSASALKASESLAVETCVQSIGNNRSSRFLRELANLLKSFGPQVHGAYLVYPSGPNNTDNGACGCEQNYTSSAASDSPVDEFVAMDGDTNSYSCFTVLPNQTIVSFTHTRIPPSSPSNNYSAGEYDHSAKNLFIRNYVSKITSNDVSQVNNYGVWTAPFSYDPSGYELMAFVLPLEFQTDATTGVESCTRAIVVEISLSIVPKLLTTFTNNGTTEVHWLDMETLQYMGSSSSYYQGASYSWTDTPNATINNIMKQVSTAAGSDVELVNRIDALTLNGAAHIGGAVDQVINYARVFRPGLGVSIEQRTRWGLVEMLSATAALDMFYPVPAVTSSSQALALLPMDVNLRLFAVVLVLLFVFTLNLFVLGCSTVGERPQWSLGTTPAASRTPGYGANTPMPLLSVPTPMALSTKAA
jgi:hypothetical protein